ncbi:MAG TPA: UvrD-helicase domain-containing protein, partial [Paludibacter sp.]|nr:UvrD-helicase domain-containing protein [Paludibacter sp.]
MFLDLSKSENRQLLNWLTQFAEDRVENSENWNPRRSIEDLGKEIFKENYQNKAEDISQKLHNHDFLMGYRAKLRKIEKDFEEKVKMVASEALNILQTYDLTTESFKGGSRSPMKILDKLLKGTFEMKDTFLAMVDDIGNCYSKSTPKITVASIENAYFNGLQQKMQLLKEMFEVDIVYYNSALIIQKHINTLGILSDLALQIKKLTGEQNSMLISDANMLLNRIIDNSDTPFVYEKTGIHTEHFMIDEFQDTSVLQWKNFYPLISNSLSSGKFNLVVGDVKQSIYRWRNSDWKLLDEKVTADFRSEQLHEENLDTNWRSDRNIVEFNNEFFRCAATLLQQKLNQSIQPVLPVYPELETLTHRIDHAYGQLHQKTSANAGVGRVNVTFIEKDENDEGWKTESLNRLPALLEDLQSRGFRPCDVAILVKKNDEAQLVTQKLLTYKTTGDAKPGCSYDIMGNEGLLIASASSVRFILGILKLMIQPADTIQQTIVNYEYARAMLGLAEKDALNACFSGVNTDGLYLLFSAIEKEKLNTLKHNSLYEIVEQLISLFNVGSWLNQAVFVQAFQDVVFKFTTGKTTDLYGFVKWWDKTGIKQCISTPENPEAFRIMTIHKSKGLDFKVVIIPFCEWEIEKKSGYFRNVLWCEPKEAPFNELPILPVEYSSKLGNSIFAGSYFDELMHQYIDNLNVAYVAFTRAKHELICMAPLAESKSGELAKISSIAGLMLYSFQQNIDKNITVNTIENAKSQHNINLTENFSIEDKTFNSGEPTTCKYVALNEDESNERLSEYPSVSSGNRLQIRHKSLDYWLENQQLTDSRLNYGIIMHDILSKIIRKSDQEIAVNEMIREGRINHQESLIVLQEMEKFWALPETSVWFADDVQVMNESTILTPTGELYRPDRVIFKDKLATVIDYKFGDRELEKYNLQVKSYMKLIAEMGYEACGFVCYVSMGKVVVV